MSNFRPINRDTGYLLPPSVDEWLPQRHLARSVVEVIDGLDLSELVKAYRGSGIASYHPAMLLGLLVYAYATKVFSSRAIERATHDSVAFCYIAGNEHSDHDTIAAFRKRFVSQLGPLFLEVLKLAREQAEHQSKLAARRARETRGEKAAWPFARTTHRRSERQGSSQFDG
jgi:transposase